MEEKPEMGINFMRLKVLFIALVLLSAAKFSLAQSTPILSINACNNCSFQLEENSMFYDNGGKDGYIENQSQTTTFRSDGRRGKKLSMHFSELDLPLGAYIRVKFRNFGETEYRNEHFITQEKKANIIADEIVVEYIPALSASIAQGWEARIDILDMSFGMVAGRPESDCANAIPLCANQTVVALGGLYTDLGAVNDDSGNCYSGTGSGGSVWYTFTPLTNGPLDFRITPTSGGTDYDYVIWDITNGCNSKSQVACNYSLYTGQTGMSGTLCNTFEGDCTDDCTSQSKGASCNRYNNRVNVQSNRVYAICINFFSGSNGGFTLQFQNEPGSVAITDNKPPQVANGFFSDCSNASNFTVQFTEYIQCSSVSNSTFSLPGYTFTLTNTNCFDNRTKSISFTVTPALPAGGQYNVSLQGIRDLCNNVLNVNYLIDLSNPPNPSITNANPICRNPTPNGGFSNAPANQTITASGGTSYLWSTGQTSAGIQVNPSNTTTYTVTVYRGACAGTASRTVIVRRAAAVSLGPDKITCGSPVTLSASPASFNNYQFFRSPSLGPLVFNNGTSVQNGVNPNLSVSPTANTTYRVIVTDANGCKAQDDVRVIVTTDSNATIQVSGNNFCRLGNPIPLDAVPPGGTFSGPGVVGNTFNPGTAGLGTHTILYSVTNSCGTYRDTITLTVRNGTLPNLGLDSVYCVGRPEFGFTPTPRCGILSGPGITNPGVCLIPTAYAQNPRFNPGQAGVGTHTLTINYPASSTGCSNTFIVKVQDSIPPVMDDPGGPYCSNVAPFELSANPTGGTFSGPGVSGTTFNPAAAGVGSHTVTYTLQTCKGVSSDFKIIQVVASNANATISYGGSPYCRSVSTIQNVTLTGTTGGTFTAAPAGLSINATTGAINPSASTVNTYTVTYSVNGGGGCGNFSTTTSVTITNSITPTFNAIPAFCAGTTAPALPVTSTNNITGTWSPAIINNSSSGTYTFTPNPGQCAVTATLNVTVNASTTPTFSAIAPICSGAAAPVLPGTSNNGVSGTWNPATVNNTASGTYTFTPAAGQCAPQTTLDVTVNALPNVNITDPSPICVGESAVLTASGANTYTWSPAGGLSATTGNPVTATPASTTVYTVTGTGANGCTGTDSTTVTVNPAPNMSEIFTD